MLLSSQESVTHGEDSASEDSFTKIHPYVTEMIIHKFGHTFWLMGEGGGGGSYGGSGSSSGFETGSLFLLGVLTFLKFMTIFLPQHPKCWDDRHESPHLGRVTQFMAHGYISTLMPTLRPQQDPGNILHISIKFHPW